MHLKVLTYFQRLLPLAVVCGWLGVGCNSSTTTESALDATADAPSQTNDGSLADSGQDAPAQDGTVSSLDGSTADASATDGGGDVSPSDGGSANGDASDGGASDGGSVTRLLVPGTSLSISGVTSDGYVVYFDNSTLTYYARPLSGGPATAIYTAPLSGSAGYGIVIGKVAFVWWWNSHYIGTLTTWSSGMSQGASLTTAGLAYLYQTLWVSEDSTHIAYLQSTSSDATVGSLYGANADGSGVTLLLSNIDINDSFQGNLPACFPRLVFRGDYAVVSYCTAADAGLTPEIQSFSLSNGWARAAAVPNWVDSLQYNALDQAPFTFPFAVDPDGERIAAASASSGNGSLQVFPIDGGPGTVVDPTVQVGPSLSFAGSVNSPWSLFYNNDAGVLKQAFATNPTPQTLVDAGVNFFNAFSGDGKWMLVSNQLNGGWFADLSLASTQSPGVPVLVASSSQYDGGPVTPKPVSTVARGFTTDSAYVLAMTNLAQNNAGRWIGYLRSMPVTPPYATKRLTDTYVMNFVTLRGSKVLVDDNFQDTDGGAGSVPMVDIDVVDPASGGSTVNIAKGVPGDLAVSSDLTQVAYTVATGGAPGIYVSTLP